MELEEQGMRTARSRMGAVKAPIFGLAHVAFPRSSQAMLLVEERGFYSADMAGSGA